MLTLGLSATGFAGKQTTWRHLKDASYDFPFAAYLAEYGKEYNGAEFTRREANFKASLAAIREHNEGDHTWKMGLSEHSDKDEGEWAAMKGLHRGLLW